MKRNIVIPLLVLAASIVLCTPLISQGRQKSVLVPLAQGFEEIEAITAIDILRRAGAEVVVASLDDNRLVIGAGNVAVTADTTLAACRPRTFDMILLPGGLPGAENLRDCVLLKEMLITQDRNGRYIAAICASPALVLNTHGLLKNRKATAYPLMADQLDRKTYVNMNVVIDGHIITSQGPGTSMAFALAAAEILVGGEQVKALKKGMLVE